MIIAMSRRRLQIESTKATYHPYLARWPVGPIYTAAPYVEVRHDRLCRRLAQHILRVLNEAHRRQHLGTPEDSTAALFRFFTPPRRAEATGR